MILSSDAAQCLQSNVTVPSEDCQSDRSEFGADRPAEGGVLLRQSFNRLNLHYILDNHLGLVCPLTEAIQDAVTLAYGQYDDSYRFQLAISLDESLTNAIVHGNLEVCSDIRNDALYDELMATRPFQMPYRDRRVYVDLTLDREQIIILVRDEGPGFELASIPDPTAPENLERESGRGLALMHHLMDAVLHNARGNAVTMIKRAP